MLRLSDVQDKLDNVRNHELPIADFRRWIMAHGWNLGDEALNGSDVYQLVRQIQLRFAEYDQDNWTDSELVQELENLSPARRLKVLFSGITSTAPVTVSLDFDPEPEPEQERYIKTSVSRRPQWFAPVLAEL